MGSTPLAQTDTRALTLGAQNISWMDRGRCYGMDPECRNYALVTKQEHGVWGGLSEQERRKLRRGVPLDEPERKRCRACGVLKAVTAFGLSGRWRRGVCRACLKARSKEWRATDGV